MKKGKNVHSILWRSQTPHHPMKSSPNISPPKQIFSSMRFIILIQIIFFTGLQAKEERKPNMIFIYTDDWGIGKVPCYNYDKTSPIKTPNIDQLRNEGMLFTNAYAANAVCGASRNSLLTGKHPGHSTQRANTSKKMKGWPPSSPMLGQVAQKAGYKTACYGKICARGVTTANELNSQGWDYWLGFLDHVSCRHYYSPFIWENGKKILLEENNTAEVLQAFKGGKKDIIMGNKGLFLENYYTDKILDFITENKNKPFFIYFASVVPHGGPPGGMSVPDLQGYDKAKLTKLEQHYCALMSYHDKNVGRILKKVKELGLAKDTIIIWTSDNGDSDSYYRRTKTFDGNGPFKGKKHHLSEGGIRAPFIVWNPSKLKAGSASNLITSHIDLMPTLAEVGGLKQTKEMDGISILPTLTGNPKNQQKRNYLYWEYYGLKKKQQAVRYGNWKAIRIGGPNGKIELYRLDNDIGEEEDLAASNPELVEQIKTIMTHEHEPHPMWNFEE